MADGPGRCRLKPFGVALVGDAGEEVEESVECVGLKILRLEQVGAQFIGFLFVLVKDGRCEDGRRGFWVELAGRDEYIEAAAAGELDVDNNDVGWRGRIDHRW